MDLIPGSDMFADLLLLAAGTAGRCRAFASKIEKVHAFASVWRATVDALHFPSLGLHALPRADRGLEHCRVEVSYSCRGEA